MRKNEKLRGEFELMFQDLTDKLDTIFKKLRGHGRLSEKNIEISLREVRRALLEADVNYKVVKEFIKSVKGQAVGQKVMKSITPGQQIIKIIHDELITVLGKSGVALSFSNMPPTVIMLVGLQGSGKTTLAGKLGVVLKNQDRNPVLVAADVQRPAAIDQLKIVGETIGVPVIAETSKDPVKICKNAIDTARKQGYDVTIFDTAGRLHVDEELMQELIEIKNKTKPQEILFVADGMTGQDAVNTAKSFLEHLDFSGVVLTKMDGDARGGAAISIRAVTGKPIKYLSVGEKFDALEKFHPDRMASRILGMGDVVTLVEKAQMAMEEQEAQTLEKKLRRQEFTLNDFLDQLQQIKKMGPLDQLISMIPGVNAKALKGMQVDNSSLVKIEAMINSMTKEERSRPQIINGSRRRRIAKGSGTTVQDLNRLLKQFQMMQKMFKNMGKSKFKGLPGFQF